MSKKIYFPGLNGLRFFAAFAVIVTHIELMKDRLSLENNWQEPLFKELGSLGVYFFFVLSGFLITYLLLHEGKEHNKIDIKAFYIRRILRIWPLYFLILILGFFILPQFEFFQIPYLSDHFEKNYWENFAMYMIIFPNLAFSFFPAVPLIGQSWSIGVEEQFYIIWPWLFRKLKNILRKIIWFLAILLLLKAIVLVAYALKPEIKGLEVLKTFLAMSKMENMAIGGIGAFVLYHQKDKILNLVYHPIIQILAFVTPFVLIYITPAIIQDGIHIVHAVLFLIIILNISSNKKSLLKLENKVFDFLGKISYGLYMYHLLAVFIVIKLLCVKNELSVHGFGNNLIIYSSCLAFTILIASISYFVFERPFIKRKIKFSTIISGDNAKATESE